MDTPTLITRQEAIAQSCLSSGQLSRLDKGGLIVPKKYGSKARPYVLYTPLQLRALKLIAKTNKALTVAEIKVMLNSFLDRIDQALPISEEWLFIAADKAYFISQAEIGEKIQALCQENKAVALKIVKLCG